MNHQELPDLPAHHRRLLSDTLDLGRPYGLALMGSYAIQAHGIGHRPSQDLDFATTHPTALPQIADHLTQGLSARGWRISAVHTAPLKARFLATDPTPASPAKSTSSRRCSGSHRCHWDSARSSP
ncbi:hypothetical protein PV396_42345 [Streptomyces sp. ME02-8801-2C]|uniref:hypothetical protein n=1 Tax=Streptomyces sp. ME02-8801-2C TaxID=3028680 RepID=UPI0029B2C5A6|nr:hypothetical protein [Streptomyces sp. ME02-8801-2C]MDX3458506.1 hypothetical protein [Streptomyces sp. ME02-8801-2C]